MSAGSALAELLSVPAVEQLARRCSAVVPLGHVEEEPVAIDLDVGSAWSLDDLESEPDCPRRSGTRR